MTPEQELAYGKRLAAHEATIDRSYMKDRTSNNWWEAVKPFPNITMDHYKVVNFIYKMPVSVPFKTKDILDVGQSTDKIRKTINKLIDCLAVEQIRSSSGLYYQYKTTPATQPVLRRILFDG